MKKIIAILLLVVMCVACFVACEEPTKTPEPIQEQKYKYNPDNLWDQRVGFINDAERLGREPAKYLSVCMRNYVSLNNINKEYTPSDFLKVDCIKVEDFTATRSDALNLMNDPNFDENILLKSLDEFTIGLNLYFEDDSYEHLCEVGQILFDSNEDIHAVNLCPAKMGGWMSSDSTLIDSWSVDKISLPRALEKIQPSSNL